MVSDRKRCHGIGARTLFCDAPKHNTISFVRVSDDYVKMGHSARIVVIVILEKERASTLHLEAGLKALFRFALLP
jgi:hypothetical protein